MSDLIERHPTEEHLLTPVVYIDTEFTSLTREPLLLSVGMVTSRPGDAEFYAEVTDEARIDAASAFTKAVVLPQFGKVAGAACRYAELSARVACFLEAMVTPLPSGRRAVVAYESDRDWTLIALAVRDFDGKRWRDLQAQLQPKNVYNMPGFAAGERAADRYFGEQLVAPFSRHHALCDARALRISCSAAAAWMRNQATPPAIAALARRYGSVPSGLCAEVSASQG